jgi:hypothetical protein
MLQRVTCAAESWPESAVDGSFGMHLQVTKFSGALEGHGRRGHCALSLVQPAIVVHATISRVQIRIRLPRRVAYACAPQDIYALLRAPKSMCRARPGPFPAGPLESEPFCNQDSAFTPNAYRSSEAAGPVREAHHKSSGESLCSLSRPPLRAATRTVPGSESRQDHSRPGPSLFVLKLVLTKSWSEVIAGGVGLRLCLAGAHEFS